MNKKIWKDVVGYEKFYQVSNDGEVRGVERSVEVNKGIRIFKSKILLPQNNNTGYLVVRLAKNGIKKQKYIHKLVAEAFILNPLQKLEVNHINGIKQDNSLKNLEYVTRSENCIHAFKLGLIKVPPSPKSICVFNICNGEEFKSIKQAALANGINYKELRRTLRRKKEKREPSCLQLKK